MWPWNKNSKLIEELHRELNDIKVLVQTVQKEQEFAKLLKKYSTEIKEDIVREIDFDKISRKIADVVSKNLKDSKTGIV